MKNFAISISQAKGPNVYDVRNQCLGANYQLGLKQKPWNSGVDYDYLMWIDSDMVFQVNQLLELIKHDKDIVSGVYRNIQGTYSCGHWDKGDPFLGRGGLSWTDEELKKLQKKDELVDVDYTGFGWILIKKGVMESIRYPWFEPEIHEVDGKRGYFAEDVSWCRKVKEQGHQIYVDPKIVVGHEKEWVLN